jgi:hypothetical protein
LLGLGGYALRRARIEPLTIEMLGIDLDTSGAHEKYFSN